MPVFALIPAAGSGSRFAGGQPKQYARIAGKVEYSVKGAGNKKTVSVVPA